jgi:hypothetical protein
MQSSAAQVISLSMGSNPTVTANKTPVYQGFSFSLEGFREDP